MVWFPIEEDGHPTIDTDLDTHFFRIPIVGWMTIDHIPCFDCGTYVYLVGGLEHVLFSYILGIIIPID